MKMKRIVIGFVAGLALGAALPAYAQSFEVDTVCELNLLELEGGELANVPENQRTSHFAPVEEGDFAIRKCTGSASPQTQMLSCRRLIFGWADPRNFQTRNFDCQMISCENEEEFILATEQMLRVRRRGRDTVEVLLDCHFDGGLP